MKYTIIDIAIFWIMGMISSGVGIVTYDIFFEESSFRVLYILAVVTFLIGFFVTMKIRNSFDFE